MLDYLKTGQWISPYDALPPERQNVLALVQGKPVVAYLAGSVWYAYDWPALQTPTIGSTQAVTLWMHIPSISEPQPEVQVLVEATAVSVTDLSLRRDDVRRLGDPPAPVAFSGATIHFDGAFDRVGPVESRPIARLRIIVEYE